MELGRRRERIEKRKRRERSGFQTSTNKARESDEWGMPSNVEIQEETYSD